MQKLVLANLPKIITLLENRDAVQFYYSEECEDFFVICSDDKVKNACLSLHVLNPVVNQMVKTGLKFNNIFVIAGLIYSSEQMTKLSISAFNKDPRTVKN